MMDIRRQYSLPNCTLVLEGYSDGGVAGTGGSSLQMIDSRPLMSILVNAECHFAGHQKPLSGGRDFFESLVMAVSGYAQEFLSGVPQPALNNPHPGGVKLQKVDYQNLHRLSVQPTSSQGQDNHTAAVLNTGSTAVDITTVQLFDLVEAIDQFLTDARTLPELSLRLTPVSKRDAASREPVAKRATPAAVGVAGLTLAAIAFSLIPPPKVNPPVQEPVAGANSSNTTPSPSPSSSAQPTTPTPSPTTSSPTPAPAPSDLEALLTSVPEITDATQLRRLQRRLYDKVNQAWVNRQKEGDNLVYLVGMGKDGAIVGYKPINQAASDRAQSTPLPNLSYIPTSGNPPARESIAQFKVVFTNRGILQVSPWNGYKGQPSLGLQITDKDQLKNLKQGLYDQVRKNWSGTPTFTQGLIYRVAVTKDGVIADYEPKNQSAFDYEKETPLPNLLKASDESAAVSQEPLAQFQITFKPNGVLEVGTFSGN